MHVIVILGVKGRPVCDSANFYVPECNDLFTSGFDVIVILFLFFLPASPLFIITIKDFTSLATYLYFAMFAKVWLAFYLGFFGNFKGCHCLFKEHF